MKKVFRIFIISLVFLLFLVPRINANQIDPLEQAELYMELTNRYDVSTDKIEDLNYKILQVIGGEVELELILKWIEENEFSDLKSNINTLTMALDSNQPIKEVIQSIKDDSSLDFFNKYKIEIYTEKKSYEQVWMPIPKNWDNHGTNKIEILDIQPEPTDIYTDKHGNDISYWENNSNDEVEYIIEFEIVVSNINHNISEDDYSINYDKDSEVFQKYATPTETMPIDHPKIVKKSNEIIGDANDPVEKARKILEWTSININYPGEGVHSSPHVLDVIENKKGDCAAFSNMFVALSKAAGVPARNVSLIHSPGQNKFRSGAHFDTFSTHVISEIYLQDYGWVQVEPQNNPNYGEWLGNINEDIIILTKGSTFNLKNIQSNIGVFEWFHLPVQDGGGQINLYMTVEEL